MDTKSERFNGKDGFGRFRIRGGPCTYCGAATILCVGYHGVTLPAGIKVEDTILADKDNHLGINCGCYAKFHRQVAHIKDRMEARK
jgi:hypothetical protein